MLLRRDAPLRSFIYEQYEDKTFSYVDATSFSVMERLGIGQAFAFDPHFEQYGLRLLR